MIFAKPMLFTCIIVTSLATAAAGQIAPLKLPDCPVMGEPIDFTLSVRTDEGPVYVCCKGCIGKLEEKPDKYAEKISKQRKILSKFPKVQVNCPVDEKPVSQSFSTKHAGSDIHFCCNECKDKFAADPKPYTAALANSYTYQTKCPVGGEDIVAGSFGIMPTGQKIYYCCDACDVTLRKDPMKYKKTLEAMGIYIDTNKIKGSTGKSK